ncbi:hypothetical protein PIROE2DRAFT_17417 [Piromyces sp. E2]|nr:hypothetical protein PIROE2DRAFT_17417 [Piromyces sp. E2]|eukprot:OUM57566.1 hypothetical protein PIROE2DRAFT_17417 [Piromyces sp. E2]
MSQVQIMSIAAHKSKSNYDAKQKKFKNSLANLQDLLNDNKPESQRKISKAQTYRLLNCVKVLEYLKDYEIQPCNERICRALKQYGKNRENICKLWEQVLRCVNNKKESINSILVKNIWMQMYNSNNNCNVNFSENMNNQSYNNYAQPSYQNNNSYPTPDKKIFIKEYNNNYHNNTNNNFLPSPECKPMFMENSYNNYPPNEYSSSSTTTTTITTSNNTKENESSEFCCTYPALYKPAWTISIEQLQNGSKKQQNYSQQHYPSPASSPINNNNNNFNYYH